MLEYLLGILNVCILEVCAESRSFAVPHHKCNVQTYCRWNVLKNDTLMRLELFC